jgi:translation initiation factor IF-1
MTTTTNAPTAWKKGDRVTVKTSRGAPATGKVLSRAAEGLKGLWVAVKLDDGREIKARPGSLTLA